MLILLLWACGGPTPTRASPMTPGVVGGGSVELPDRYPTEDTGSIDTGETGDTAVDVPYAGPRYLDVDDGGQYVCFVVEGGRGACTGTGERGDADEWFGQAPQDPLAETQLGVALTVEGRWVLWSNRPDPAGVLPTAAGFHDLACSDYACAALGADGSITSVEIWRGKPAVNLPGPFLAFAQGQWEVPLCGLRESGVVTCWDADWVATDVLSGDYQFISVVSNTVCAYGHGGIVDCFQGAGDPDDMLTPPGEYTSAASYDFAGCAIRADTGLSCWGRTISSTGEPITRSGVPPSGIAKVAIDSASGCYITTEGELKCWPGDYTPVE